MAANTSEKSPLIIVILGCTGTGKSKLSIELGKRIGGEVISADSMQVYKGLDIITNKVTAEERATIPHHLLDFVEANEKFSVVEFKTIALDTISDILARQKIPIIVGGTNYYIESLLWENLIDEKNEGRELGERDFSSNSPIDFGENDEKIEQATDGERLLDSAEFVEREESKQTETGACSLTNNENEFLELDSIQTEGISSCILQGSSEDTKPFVSLHQQLAKVDFTMAQKLHPNDTRKIKRSLQVFEQSGIAHSDHIAQQQSQQGSSEYSGPMRFENVCVLWLQCEFETLDNRLDARVEQMIEQGLVKELVEFHTSWKSASTNTKMENNEGIFQSIGFKEFREFLNIGNSKVEENPELFEKCVEAMKCATRRYARKQVRWVNNRFLGRPSTSSPDVYGLDATDLGKWENEVLEKALDVVKVFAAGEEIRHVPLERVCSSAAAKHAHHTCTVCHDRIIIGDQNWSAHLRSRSHRHYKKKKQKLDE